ncbi:interleukin-1 beta [Pelobates cultripes]|uniref:Interleukin-1 beta n=1 Tax=Pelobates cultripes TaxID=61616 RepID=A0AAD1RQ88_PELCU|nr:interleukin-1 beta [Pelobates cultripes]
MEITRKVVSGYSFGKTVLHVVAVQKLRKGISYCPRRFQDTDVQNLLNDIFVQEEEILTSTKAFVAPKYKLLGTKECTMRDRQNKCMTLHQNPEGAQLVAIYLNGVNIQREEKISMSFYTARNLDISEKRPVALGLGGKNLYLACSLEDSEPQLQLENIQIPTHEPRVLTHDRRVPTHERRALKWVEQSINNISGVKDEELPRFLFLKSENVSTSSFESAAYPGWYISTSQAENSLVGVKPQVDQKYIREFLVLP